MTWVTWPWPSSTWVVGPRQRRWWGPCRRRWWGPRRRGSWAIVDVDGVALVDVGGLAGVDVGASTWVVWPPSTWVGWPSSAWVVLPSSTRVSAPVDVGVVALVDVGVCPCRHGWSAHRRRGCLPVVEGGVALVDVSGVALVGGDRVVDGAVVNAVGGLSRHGARPRGGGPSTTQLSSTRWVASSTMRWGPLDNVGGYT